MKTIRIGAVVAAALLSLPAHAAAQGTPWIGEPGTGAVSLYFSRQSATEYYRLEIRPTPGDGAVLSQNTGWLGITYALSDAVSVDLLSGLARSHIPGAVGPTTQESFSGLIDTHLNVTWRVSDELLTGMPSVALSAGVIGAGPYETGHINALGDGGNGVQGSVVVGQFINRVGFSAEGGYRYRTENIPSEVFVNLSGYLAVTEQLTLIGDFRVINSAESGIEIGGAGFTAARFPEVEEDIDLLGARMLLNLTDEFGVNAFYGKVIDGRNTAASHIFGGGITHTFGSTFE